MRKKLLLYEITLVTRLTYCKCFCVLQSEQVHEWYEHFVVMLYYVVHCESKKVPLNMAISLSILCRFA